MDIPNSSYTKCPKCEKTQFELVEDYPTNSQRRFWYMRCTSCKSLAHVFPYEDTNTLINKIIKFLKIY